MMNNKKGFTLIEMILVVALLGILAAAALPRMFSISLTNARNNARTAIASAVQTGLSLYAANQVSLGNAITYPTQLDNEAAAATSGPDNPFFENVIQGGVTTLGWSKTTANKCYTFDNGGTTETYTYDSTNGTFLKTTTCTE